MLSVRWKESQFVSAQPKILEVYDEAGKFLGQLPVTRVTYDGFVDSVSLLTVQMPVRDASIGTIETFP